MNTANDKSADRHSKPQMELHRFGRTGLDLPGIVYGTSCLGNLYEALSLETKLNITREWFAHHDPPAVIDTAGKYGAGLALETIGRNLRALEIPSEQIVISNKLGWKRVPLRAAEPTFEPGVWANLDFDAEQCISYDGIYECWLQGCELLGEGYQPQLLSVHDPDEYLAAATSAKQRDQRRGDILGAYQRLQELKNAGHAAGIGVGAKDWRVIAEIAGAVELDWVMLANSLTIFRHPPELLEFVKSLVDRGTAIVNSAVFHSGFLVGGPFFDYRRLSASEPDDQPIYAWRDAFHQLCEKHDVVPAVACVQFALSPPGVAAISLNTSRPDHVVRNVESITTAVPAAFWGEAKAKKLIDADYPYM
ncbi:MAG: aldo/keto reductase [Planctomycetota bacterium]